MEETKRFQSVGLGEYLLCVPEFGTTERGDLVVTMDQMAEKVARPRNPTHLAQTLYGSSIGSSSPLIRLLIMRDNDVRTVLSSDCHLFDGYGCARS